MCALSRLTFSQIQFEAFAGNDRLKNPDPDRRENRSRREPRRKSAGNRVLLLGKLRELALYRAEVLRDRGFDVKIPATAAEAVAEITRGEFDVAVFSYTLSSDEVQSLAELVRQSCPKCPLVAISATGMLDRKVDPDEIVLADDGPEGLIKVLRRLQRLH
jgi:hypothetical protein